MASVEVSEKYKTLANALTRQVETQVIIYDYLSSKKEWRYGRTYNEQSGIVSWSISGGKQSGAFEIGKTICKSLELELQRGTIIAGNAKIDVRVRFVNPEDIEDVSEWLTLGIFYADKITVVETSGIKKVVAMDYMLQLEKSYRTQNAYPMEPAAMLTEISEQARFEIADNIDYINTLAVSSFPYKGQSQVGLRILFTRREIVGFLASLQAGSAYFTRENKLDFTGYEKNPEPINLQQCFNSTTSGYDYNITDVVWEESGGTSAADIEDSYRQIFFKNQLDFGNKKTNVLNNIKTVLVGKNIRQFSVEKQGTGFYEIGETVTINDPSGSFDIVVSGIKYNMSSGGFRETIYSVAQSETESNYGGDYTTESGNNSVTSILYQQNEIETELNEDFQEIFSLQFSSVSNASCAVAVTLNPIVTEAGTITTTVVIDTKIYGTFTDVVEVGENVVTIVLPLISLPNGGHLMSIQVQAGAVAKIPEQSSYLTLFANGVATEAGFNGVLQIKQEVKPITIYHSKLITVGKIKENITAAATPYEPIRITGTVPAIAIHSSRLIKVGKIIDIPGGNDVAYIDSRNRLMYTRDLQRIHVKRIHF